MKSYVAFVVLCVAASAIVRAQSPDEARRWAEQHYRVEQRRDDFTGTTQRSLELSGRDVVDERRACNGWALLTLGRQDTVTFISVHYTAPDWLFISQESGMLALADSGRMEFPLASRPTRVVGVSTVPENLAGHKITEAATYAVSREALQRLASAQVARLRIPGSEGHGNCDITLLPRGQALVGLFVGRELTPPR